MTQSCLSTKSLFFHRIEFLKRVKIIFVFFFVFWGVRLMWTTSCRRWIVLNLYFYFWLYLKISGKLLGIFEKWLLETKTVFFFEITYMKQKLIFPSDVLIVFKFLIVSLFVGFLVIPNSLPCVALSSNSICCSFGVLRYIQIVQFLTHFQGGL